MMGPDWQTSFRSLVSGLSWDSLDDGVKQKIYDFVARSLSADSTFLANALKKALIDGKLTKDDANELLVVLIQDWLGEAQELQFVRQLLDRLKDGRLTSQEISEVAAEWMASKTPDQMLKQLIKAAADGHLDTQAIQAAIVNWLDNQSPNLGAKLQQMLDDSAHPVGLRDIALLVVSFATEKGGITGTGTTNQERAQSVVTALANYVDSDLKDVIEAIVAKENGKAVSIVLDKLGIDVSGALAKAFLSGNTLREGLAGMLSKLLSSNIDGISADDSKTLAERILGLMTAKYQLIAKQTEQEQLGMYDWQYVLWLEIRKILFAASLAVRGGGLVPLDPMAQPYVFAAATITPKTLINTLSQPADYGRLATYISNFLASKFGDRPGGDQYKYRPSLNAQMIETKNLNALSVFLDARMKLYPIDANLAVG